MVRQDFSLKHLMFLQEFHLGLQVAEVSFTVLCHLLHPLRHPLLCLTHRNRSRWMVKQCYKQRIELEIRPEFFYLSVIVNHTLFFNTVKTLKIFGDPATKHCPVF